MAQTESGWANAISGIVGPVVSGINGLYNVGFPLNQWIDKTPHY